MKIFFDTEFTGLHKDTTLISIGLVDEDGRTFYAEFLGYNRRQCDDWIKENVLAHLKFHHDGNWSNEDSNHLECVGYTTFIRNLLCLWLNHYDDVQLVSDCCHYDMVLFIDLFGDAFRIPSNVNATCHDINQDIARYFGISEKEAFDKSREEIVGDVIEGDKHNALYDAKVIREIYRIIEDKQ